MIRSIVEHHALRNVIELLVCLELCYKLFHEDREHILICVDLAARHVQKSITRDGHDDGYSRLNNLDGSIVLFPSPSPLPLSMVTLAQPGLID